MCIRDSRSPLETPFSVESLFSDQMDDVQVQSFTFWLHTLFSDKKRAYQYKTTTTLTTHSISNESQWRYNASLQTLTLGLLETINWSNNIAYTAWNVIMSTQVFINNLVSGKWTQHQLTRTVPTESQTHCQKFRTKIFVIIIRECFSTGLSRCQIWPTADS